MTCCTARVESISSKDSSGHAQKSAAFVPGRFRRSLAEEGEAGVGLAWALAAVEAAAAALPDGDAEVDTPALAVLVVMAGLCAITLYARAPETPVKLGNFYSILFYFNESEIRK